MRTAAIAALAALALAAPAAAGDGDWATASYADGTATLKLHYLMTCGQPGQGPVEVRLPHALRLARPARALVNGKPRPMIYSAHSATVQLPKPPEVTCMSIAPGVLAVAVRTIHGATGTYTIRASIGTHGFAPKLRVP